MTAYVIVDIDVTDPVNYEEYKRLAPPTVAAYGGRYIARGGPVQVLEGSWTPKRLVLLEFESVERARQWYESPEYKAIVNLRLSATQSNMVVIGGVA